MLKGPTIRGERGRRAVWVCGPAAFVVMKALALHLRGENKDAYDLTYLLRFGPSLEVVAKQLTLMKDEPEVREGLGYLREASRPPTAWPTSSRRVLLGEPNDAEEADAYGVVQDLLALVPA